MPTLTELTSGFTAGDLDVSGYIATVPGFQQVFIADGRPYDADISESGYHRIDMTSTCLVGEASGEFTVGEAITQEGTGAEGIFVETVGIGATAKNLVYRITTTEFDTSEVVGGTSTETLTPTSVVAPPHWLNWTLKANDFSETGGTFPDGGSNIMCLFEGRIWMNSMYNPNQFFATRQGDPFDLDTSLDDVQAAINSQTSLTGLVGDALVALISFKDNYLLFGCSDSFWILRGGSTGAGNLSNLSYETGIFSPDSYCWDNEGNLYVISMNGFFKFPNSIATSGASLDNISLRLVPNLFNTLRLNRKTDKVILGFDRVTNKIQVAISTQDGSWSVNFSYDIASDSIIPDTLASTNIPSAFLYVNSFQDEVSGLLMGCYDGYIKKFDPLVKTDDGELIDSYVLFGPITVNTLLRANVKIKEVLITLSEAADGVEWELYQAKSNELIVKGIKAGTLTPTHSGTFTSGGREATIYEKIAGESLAIMLKNSTLDTTWGLENIKIRYTIAGKVKD